MSASRTLLRRNKLAAYDRDEDGKLVKRIAIKPGTPFRSVLFERREGDHLHSYHATKGHRWLRQSA